MRLFRRIREAAEVVRKSAKRFPATQKFHNCELSRGGKSHKRDSWKRVFELTSPNSLLRSRTCANLQKRKCALVRSFSPRLPPRVHAPADADRFRLAEEFWKLLRLPPLLFLLFFFFLLLSLCNIITITARRFSRSHHASHTTALACVDSTDLQRVRDALCRWPPDSHDGALLCTDLERHVRKNVHTATCKMKHDCQVVMDDNVLGQQSLPLTMPPRCAALCRPQNTRNAAPTSMPLRWRCV